MRASAIILAAGRSQRMGTPKLVLPFRGDTVLGQVLRALARPGIEERVVVVGHHHRLIEPLLEAARGSGPSLVRAQNNDPEGDMASSIRIGVRASSLSSNWLIITPADLPLLRAETVDRLLGEAERCEHLKRPPVLVPVSGGRAGHPVAVPEILRADVLASSPGWTLRDLVHSPSYPVREVEVEDEGIFCDLDVPADRQALE